MKSLRRLMPRTVAAQITCLLVVSVLFAAALTSAAAIYFYRASTSAWSFETLSAVRAARIAAVIREAQAARSDADLAGIVGAASRSGLHVEVLSKARLDLLPRAESRPADMVRSIVEDLRRTWGIDPIGGVHFSGRSDSIVVDVGAGRTLAFVDVAPALARRLIAGGAMLVMTVIAFGILLLSVYAARWVTAPLSRIGAAARAFGGELSRTEALPEDGPREIAQVASALNEMRERIRALVEERTRMLLAIGHDLRTPLTRLALRTERIPDSVLRDGLQHDIAFIRDMLTETLAFLREGGSTELVRRVDLPSLLRTICGEFTDVGYAVSYEGPARLAITCRDRSLARAVVNVVDNATKHGRVVTVGLQALSGRIVEIAVSDDGPGIPMELRDKVLEPFFKIDRSRVTPERAGFGLGLSIARDVLQAHGGEIVLADNDRGGLTVQLRLPAACEEIPDLPRAGVHEVAVQPTSVRSSG